MENAARRPETVARRLERAIARGELAPGQRLPSERTLAQRWKMSRPLVREGIAMLVAKGLLSRRQGAGTFLNDAADQVGVEVWADMARRHPHLQGDLLEFRHMLECRAAELAAERHTAADRQRLELAAAAADRAWAQDDRAAQRQADLALHLTIAESTHNPVFTYLMHSLHKLLLDHMQLSQAGTAPRTAPAEDVRRQHRKLVRAILARDAAAAAHAAGTHLEYVRVHLNHLGPFRARG